MASSGDGDDEENSGSATSPHFKPREDVYSPQLYKRETPCAVCGESYNLSSSTVGVCILCDDISNFFPAEQFFKFKRLRALRAQYQQVKQERGQEIEQEIERIEEQSRNYGTVEWEFREHMVKTASHVLDALQAECISLLESLTYFAFYFKQKSHEDVQLRRKMLLALRIEQQNIN